MTEKVCEYTCVLPVGQVPLEGGPHDIIVIVHLCIVLAVLSSCSDCYKLHISCVPHIVKLPDVAATHQSQSQSMFYL